MHTKSALAAAGKLGHWEARVSELQARAILRAAGSKHGLTWEDLAGYVSTGDAGYCSGDVMGKLREICKAAKADLNESQAKRVWPRKAAAVLLDEIAAR